ncbi:MAG: hypothetical protein KDK76_07585 [Chlamydiia bacterium]|nr:hypothetical protein [Chlamydiia bacterium]
MMLYEKLIEEIKEEEISEDTRLERMNKLREFIKAQSHLHDDHGSAIIGDREHPPQYKD